MSRLNRTDAAKSMIAVWRWLCARPDAPQVVGNIPDHLSALGTIGNVSNPNALADRINLMEHLGLLKREIEHVNPPTNRPGSKENSYPALKTTTHLLVEVEAGARTIAQHFARGGYLKVGAKGNQKLNGFSAPERPVDTEKVAVTIDEKEEPVAAIVGPEAPNPFESLRELRKSEPAAFIEAARQYNNRQEFVIGRLEEMEKLGVKIDREMVMKGIKLDRDDEFEGVVKVLPYIDELESRVKQAQEWRGETISLRNEIKEIRKERDAAQAEARRQKEANARLAERHAKDTVRNTSTVLVG